MKLILILLCLISCTVQAFDHDYKSWDEILQKYVEPKEMDNFFKYLDLKDSTEDLRKFEQLLNSLSAVSLEEYSSWSEPQKLAFLFNSYNAFTVQIIMKHHSRSKPLKSIRDIGSLLKNTWKIKFFTFLGVESNLDKIEHEIARKSFNEPRLHVAFNCASRGCPNLLREAFRAKDLEKQLEKASEDFINNSSKNYYDNKTQILHLSSIFKWYGADFDKNKRFKSVYGYVGAYFKTDKKILRDILNEKPKIQFIDYDWQLNEPR